MHASLSFLVFFSLSELFFSHVVDVELLLDELPMEVLENCRKDGKDDDEEKDSGRGAHVLDIKEGNLCLAERGACLQLGLPLQVVRVVFNLVGHHGFLVSHLNGFDSLVRLWLIRIGIDILVSFPVDCDECGVLTLLVIKVNWVHLVGLQVLDLILRDGCIAHDHHLGKNLAH